MELRLDRARLYRIYGLVIQSDMVLHHQLELQREDADWQIDAEVVLGQVNQEIDDTYHTRMIFHATNNRAVFYLNGIGHFEVQGGNKIIIQPDAQAVFKNVQNHLVGSALGLMLFQRQMLTLHGGGVVIDGQGMIITGDIGAGKTTLVSTLVQQGHGFLADDAVAVSRMPDAGYRMHATFPHQKLCRHTAEAFGYDVTALELIDPVKDKYYTPVIEKFCQSDMPLGAIIHLGIGTEDRVTCEEVTGIQKLHMIQRNIYRMEIIPMQLITPSFTKACLELAAHTKIYQIKRPKDKDAVADMIQQVQKVAQYVG